MGLPRIDVLLVREPPEPHAPGAARYEIAGLDDRGRERLVEQREQREPGLPLGDAVLFEPASAVIADLVDLLELDDPMVSRIVRQAWQPPTS